MENTKKEKKKIIREKNKVYYKYKLVNNAENQINKEEKK
jgi:hypothetical protein